jgi:hypothetical protein
MTRTADSTAAPDAEETEDSEAGVLPLHPGRRPTRGRHRKPRPRRTLFAVGGLALAAGALSLARLVPESVGGGGTGATQAEARAATDGVSEEATNAAATMEAASPPAGSAGPGTTAASGAGAGAPPGATSVTIPSSPATSSVPAATAPPADPTGIPTAPATEAPAPAATAPRPAQSPTAPAPRPERPRERDQRDQRDLCVPVIGLCFNGDGALPEH